MSIRPATSPAEFDEMSSDRLRERLVVDDLFAPGELRLTATAEDRMIVGGAVPDGGALSLDAPEWMGTTTFAERHELAIVCLLGDGVVDADGTRYRLDRFDVLYLGRGTADISLSGDARFYLVAAPALQTHPPVLTTAAEASPVEVGDQANANVRTIRKYIHLDGASSSQLVLGITELAEGSVWNTMPAHTHTRRTEVYLYTAMRDDAQIVHLCGRPERTRSVILGPDQAVISPAWSVHTGVGTSSYAFVWSMAGENKDYADVITVPMGTLR